MPDLGKPASLVLVIDPINDNGRGHNGPSGNILVQMISTGEKSGKLDQMLEDVASFYDPEIEYTIKNLTALLEPFMLLTMGIMVAFIALSVLLPIFNLIKVFRG